jgi:hypothetical protein
VTAICPAKIKNSLRKKNPTVEERITILSSVHTFNFVVKVFYNIHFYTSYNLVILFSIKKKKILKKEKEESEFFLIKENLRKPS